MSQSKPRKVSKKICKSLLEMNNKGVFCLFIPGEESHVHWSDYMIYKRVFFDVPLGLRWVVDTTNEATISDENNVLRKELRHARISDFGNVYTLKHRLQSAEYDKNTIIQVDMGVGERINLRPVYHLSFEDWKPFTDICTQFITNNFMNTVDVETQFHLVNKITKACNATIKNYCARHGMDNADFHFVYKGGNVMRFLFKAFAAQQNLAVVKEVEKQYASFFAPSDMDFGVVLKRDSNGRVAPHITSEVIYSLTDALYDCLNDIKHEWITAKNNDLKTLFPFLRLSEDSQNKLIEQIFHEMTRVGEQMHPFKIKIHAINTMHFTFPSTSSNILSHSALRNDIDISFTDKSRTGRRVCENTNQPRNAIFISKNKALFFKRNIKSKAIHFDLVRMKLAFVAKVSSLDRVFTKKLGAEMIDISVCHPDEDNVKNFPPYLCNLIGEKVNMYADFTIETQTDIKAHSYSIPYLIYDILTILFYENTVPFYDAKYKKRINRMCGLLLCNVLDEKLQSESAIRLFESMKITFQIPKKQFHLSGTNEEVITMLHPHIKKNIENDREPVYSFLNYETTIYKLVTEHFESCLPCIHDPDIMTMISTYNNNIDINIQIIRKMQQEYYNAYSLSV